MPFPHLECHLTGYLSVCSVLTESVQCSNTHEVVDQFESIIRQTDLTIEFEFDSSLQLEN